MTGRGAEDGRTFELRDGRVNGSHLTATKRFADGTTEPLEGIFINRRTIEERTAQKTTSDHTAFGLGVTSVNFTFGGTNGRADFSGNRQAAVRQMSIDDFFLRLIAALERADVPYMVTGSYASSAHGEPRASNDIDIVIAPTPEQLHALVRQFPSDRYYADEEDAFELLRLKLQFNVIDFPTCWKVDLIFRKDRKFSDTEFLRRSRHVIAGREVYLATAEDILIAKQKRAN